MADDEKAAGPEKPRRPAAKKAEKAEAPKPTPESIGIEGVVRVGGHHLDDDLGWVADDDTPSGKEDD